MCGIAGSYHACDHASLHALCDLGAMQAEIRRRGPDAEGRFDADGVTLLHARLAILDLDGRSDQPMTTDRYALAYNGEIYNYRELRAELRGLGAQFETTGDTEVLLRAIETWGVEKAVRALAGMFAFALHDRSDGSLCLVRDRLGIKPLYIAEHGGAFFFASWPAALLRSIRRDWRIDRAALQDYFLLGAAWGGRFVVEGIREVAAGTILHLSGETRTTTSYWTPQVLPRRFDIEEFEHLFDEIVSQHALSDVSMGLLLSGGVDSSALAASLADADIRYFHLRSDEIAYSERVARFTGRELVVFDVEHDDDEDTLLVETSARSGNLHAAAAQPSLASRKIATLGHKVFLSANGADELFYGYSRTPLPQNLRPDSFSYHERPGAVSFSEQAHSIFRSMQNVRVPGLSEAGPIRRQVEFIHRLETEVLRHDLPEAAAYRMFELETYVVAELNTTLDHSSMCQGLEARVPFLDHRLVDYALSLEPASVVEEGIGRKAPLKRYLKKKGLFEAIWNRPKLGFTISNTNFVRRRRHQVDILRRLTDQGFVEFYPRGGNCIRDFQYVLNACHAFDAWKRCWIDSGIVDA